MMTYGFCPVHRHYEYYQQRTLVPPCPFCGWGKYGGAPLTREEYYKAMGINTSEVTHATTN